MRVEGSITEHRERDGRIRFRVRLTVDGKRRSLGVHDTREHAERVLAAAIAKLGVEEKGGVTLATWGEEWLDARETDGLHRGTSKARSCWNTHVASAPFATWPIRKIQRIDVVRWIKKLLKTPVTHAQKRGGVIERRQLGRTLGRQTVLNAFALLRRALGDAADEGHAPVNVAAGVKVPSKPRSDDTWTYLTAPEIAALLALELRAEQRAIFTTAIHTGLRGGELWGLRWADVTLGGARPELVVRHSYRGPTKSGKVRPVPLLRQAREALEAWRKVGPEGGALVFPADGGGCHHEGFEAGLRTALRQAGITRRVRFHDLRHTCGSHLISGTWGPAWSLRDVQEMLGHSSQTTTERYAHLAPERLHGMRAATDGA